MLFRTRIWFAGLIAAAFVSQAFAAPVTSSLLSLIPTDAEVVAGIEDPHNPNSHGRLLLVTRNNNLDLDDWLALTGVDSHRVVDELVEVAASSMQGDLKEHLLLIRGSFKCDQIFHSATQNGVKTGQYNGIPIMLVTPFAREQQEMSDLRWLAILDDRMSIFGTPDLVRKSLDRHRGHQLPDRLLLARLAQLHPDVNSWNMLLMSGPMLTRHVAPAQLHAPWAHILDGAHELTIGIHYGSSARIDFAVSADKDQQASSFVIAFMQPQLLLTNLSGASCVRVRSVSVEQDRVRGSITLPGKQLDQWLQAVWQSRFPVSTTQ